jgi:hypothetical protein
MKTAIISLLVGLSAFIFEVMPTHASPTPPQPYAATNAADYVVRVTWTRDKDTTQFLQVMTTEGNFQLSTSLPTAAAVQATQVQVPSSNVNFGGELKVINSEQARLSVSLGRSVPIIEGHTGPSGSSTSTYQWHQEGLSSSFIVTFGKPMVIQKDPNGEVSVLVKRESP